MAASDHADEVLRVYASRTLDDGWWCPSYGDLKAPQGWEFLPRGDVFVTRQVKELGPHWVVVRARRGYTETLGVLAPVASIEIARSLAEKTAARREAVREDSRQYRQKRELAYKQQFTEAILCFLDFAPRHRALARDIAEAAARRATEVSSGRVGRTGKLSLEEKAELAARSYIRHRYTAYEERLLEAGLFEPDQDNFVYQEIRAYAQAAVEEFLARHRRRGKPQPSGLRGAT